MIKTHLTRKESEDRKPNLDMFWIKRYRQKAPVTCTLDWKQFACSATVRCTKAAKLFNPLPPGKQVCRRTERWRAGWLHKCVGEHEKTHIFVNFFRCSALQCKSRNTSSVCVSKIVFLFSSLTEAYGCYSWLELRLWSSSKNWIRIFFGNVKLA